MGTHMKTTIELSEALLAEARKVAASEGITMRTLIEQGLRQALAQRVQHGGFQLRKATFKGRGLSTAARGASWEELREQIYKGRGGGSPSTPIFWSTPTVRTPNGTRLPIIGW